MSIVVGINKFYFGEKGAGFQADDLVDIVDGSLNITADELDSTDSGTTGDGYETTLGRTTIELALNQIGHNNAGGKLKGQDVSITLGGAPLAFQSFTFDEAYDELDATDSSTAANYTETACGRAKRTAKIVAFVNDSAAEKNPADTVLAMVITLSTGVTISGNVKVQAKNLPFNVKDISKVEYNIVFNSCVKTLPATYLPTAVVKDCGLVLKDGASSDKMYEGKCILSSLSISGDQRSDVKIAYKGKINGALTETQAAA